MSEKIAIALGTSQERVFCAGTMLLSLKESGQNFDFDVICFHVGLSDKDINALSKIYPCKFVHYNTDKIKEYVSEKNLKKYSALTFSKFDIFDYLKEYDKVIWLDTDTLICGDISHITDNCKYISAAQDNDLIDGKDEYYRFRDNFLEAPPENIIPAKYLDDINYNAGIIVFSKNLLSLSDDIKKWCYTEFQKLSPYIRWGDQPLINLIPKSFNIEMTELSPAYNAKGYLLKFKTQNPKIVHGCGGAKFWDNEDFLFLYPKWKDYYNEWVKLGGSEYDKVVSVKEWEFKYFPKAKYSPAKLLRQKPVKFILFVIRYFLGSKRVRF